MSEQWFTCSKCYNNYPFWGKHIPRCPRCGGIDTPTREEYYK